MSDSILFNIPLPIVLFVIFVAYAIIRNPYRRFRHEYLVPADFVGESVRMVNVRVNGFRNKQGSHVRVNKDGICVRSGNLFGRQLYVPWSLLTLRREQKIFIEWAELRTHSGDLVLRMPMRDLQRIATKYGGPLPIQPRLDYERLT